MIPLPEDVHEALLSDHILHLAARCHVYIGIDPASSATPEFKALCAQRTPTTAFDVFVEDAQGKQP